MRRAYCLICFVLIFSLLLSSCSETYTDLDNLGKTINKEFDMEHITAVKSLEELEKLYQLDRDMIADFFAEYTEDSSEIAEIILVRAKDTDSARYAETMLFNRLDAFLMNSKSYSPNEYLIYSKCSVEVYREIYVTLILSDKADEINAFIREKIS